MRPAEPVLGSADIKPGTRSRPGRSPLQRSGAAPLPRTFSHTNPEEKLMREKLTRKPSMVAFALLVGASVGLAGCGGVGNKQAATTPTRFAITASEAGKQLRLSVPQSVRAGLVTVELANTGKAFHEAQLIRLDPGHTPEGALKVIAAEGAPSPGWIHVAGGTGPAPPGGKRSATQRLRPGNYIAYDAPFQNEGKGLKFGLASFKVEGPADDSGELPKAVAKIEAYEYGFKASGYPSARTRSSSRTPERSRTT